MVKLRLKRIGSKFRAFYKIVAADAKAPRDGRFIEEIGYYNPHSKQLKVDIELQKKWSSLGAVATETVKKLISKYNASKPNKDGVVILKIKPKKTKSKKQIAVEIKKEA